ncbi:MAG: DUF4290 domain-containing protein [Bacteroidetes bacterium]|nr:DUF4290 domain-containing protein [Bacteroidota bacterium]
MDYNTEREHLVIREYGRHVQNLIAYAKATEDKAERQKIVDSIIQLMGQLNPHLKNVADFKHKLWDHLFMIGGFDLDVDSPYDKPSPTIAEPSPAPLAYPKQKIRYRHYGKNVQSMIEKARKYDDLEKRNGLTEVIVNFMKMAYRNWSNEEVSDELIKQDLKTLSQGTLVTSDEMNLEAFVKSTANMPNQSNSSSNKSRSSKGRGGQKNYSNKRRGNNSGRNSNNRRNRY